MDESTDNSVTPVAVNQQAINEAPEISPVDITQLSLADRVANIEQTLGINS